LSATACSLYSQLQSLYGDRSEEKRDTSIMPLVSVNYLIPSQSEITVV